MRAWLVIAATPSLCLFGCSLLTDTSGLTRASPVDGTTALDASQDGSADSSSAPPDAALPPIAFRGAQVVSPIDGDDVTIDVPIVAPDDFLLLALYQYNAGATVTGLDAGWVLRGAIDPSGSDGNHGRHSLRIYSRRVAADDPTSYKVTVAAAASGEIVSALLAAWGNVDPRLPVDAEMLVAKDFEPFVVPSITTAAVDDLLVAVTSTTYGRGASWSAPTGMVQVASTGVLGLFSQSWPDPGATGARAYASSAQFNVGSGAAVFALRRAVR